MSLIQFSWFAKREVNLIVDCEVHLLHPEACKKDFAKGTNEIMRSIVYEHQDFPLVEKKLSVEALLNSMDQNHIQWAIIMGMPWSNEKFLDDNNRYIESCVKKYQGRFKGLYIPHLEDPEKSAKKIMELDPKTFIGVKILPKDQGARIDDPRLAPIFETILKRNMLFMVHTDHPTQSDEGDTPYRLLQFLLKYPDMKVLAPHLGGLLCLYANRSQVRQAIQNVYFITSVSATMNLVSYAAQINPNNLVFGTDFPFNHCHDQSSQIEAIQKLGMSKDVQEKILGKTAQNLFNLE